jgi:microcystin-dependent protein
MANLPQSSTWEAGIYQIETTDAVIGGVNGISNIQGKQLGNRTKYLYDQLGITNTALAALDSSVTNHSGRIATLEAAGTEFGDGYVGRGILAASGSAIAVGTLDYGKLIMIDPTDLNTVVTLPNYSSLTIGMKYNFIIRNTNSTYLLAKVLFEAFSGQTILAPVGSSSGTTDGFGPGDAVEFTFRGTATGWLMTDVRRRVDGIIGEIKTFGSADVPNGWLECDGAAISRTTYAGLFARLGVTWGVGNGTTTFNLPDFRGYFLRGWDHGAGVDSARAFASSQADDLKSHDHTYNNNLGLSFNGSNLDSASGSNGSNTPRLTGATGGTETRPKNKAVLYCIKY